VNGALCVSCGICVGSCPASTPFRRSEELRTGIDLPDFPLRELRERTIAAAQRLRSRPRVLVFACSHGGAAGRPDDTIVLPCVAMVPPSLIDFALSRELADGVVVAGCAESACYHRLGVNWMKQRVAGTRDPYLRARVPRERIAMVWTSALQAARAAADIEAFTATIASLPPLRSRLQAPSGATAPARREDVLTGTVNEP
jgi:coenzyme F420-reducing hydrogenase delta subunit